MEVLVEILLALLAQPSHLIRQVARSVFSHICSHLTPRALQLILDVSGAFREMGPGMWLSGHQGCHLSPHPSCDLQRGWGPRSDSAAVHPCSRGAECHRASRRC